jgi:Flp pilus assembly protein TadD
MNKNRQNLSRHAASTPAAGGDVRPSQEPRPAWDRRIWLLAIPLALLVIAAFMPSLDNGFVEWDDEKNFLENPYFRGLGAAQVKWAWTTLWVGAYQPLAWLLFEAQYVFWKLDARGYHLTSLLLHAVNALVLYVLTVTLLVRCRSASSFKSPWACGLSAGLATVLFAVHPLRVEAVAWASCQPYLACALFSMLAVLAYLRAFWVGQSPRWGWLVSSFVLFVAALLSKAVAVSLPVVLLILDVYPLRRFAGGPGRWLASPARRALLEKVPFAIVSVVFMELAIAAKPQSSWSTERYRAAAGIAQACYGVWFYIFQTVLPLNLSALYEVPREIDWLAPPFLLSILGTLGLTISLCLLGRRWPGLLAVWLSYLAILAPNSGIVRISRQIAADRYTYMAMLGWVILAAACLCRLWQTPSRTRPGSMGIIALFVGVLLGLIPITRDQCRTWRNSETLWSHALNHGSGSSSMVHNNFGTVLQRQGSFEGAVAHYTEALRLNPSYADAHNNLGVLRSLEGKYEAAEAHYAEALWLDPGSAEVHSNLGRVLSDQGNLAEAAAQYAEVLRLIPGSAAAHNDLGLLHHRRGKFEAAAAEYTEAMRLDRGFGDAYNNLAMIMAACPEARYRDGKRAVESATRACELAQWKNSGFLDTLAAACAEAGDFDAAVTWQTKAIALLLDERKKGQYSSRLAHYRAKRPYRETPTDQPLATPRD